MSIKLPTYNANEEIHEKEQGSGFKLYVPSEGTVANTKNAKQNILHKPDEESEEQAAAIDALWATYEQQLEFMQKIKNESVEIYPSPSFTFKIPLKLNVPNSNDSKSTNSAEKNPILSGLDPNSKLFINICTNTAIDPPSAVNDAELKEYLKKASNSPSTLVEEISESTILAKIDSASGSTEPNYQNMRFPLSVGPLIPCQNKSGAPCISVDVVMNPAALHVALPNNAIVDDPTNKSIVQSRMKSAEYQLRRSVAAFVISKIVEKYSLAVDETSEPKFPKMLYKGALPPPSQRIRAKHSNPTTQPYTTSSSASVSSKPIIKTKIQESQAETDGIRLINTIGTTKTRNKIRSPETSTDNSTASNTCTPSAQPSSCAQYHINLLLSAANPTHISSSIWDWQKELQLKNTLINQFYFN